MSRKTERVSNLEFLRIVSMLLIIAFHATRISKFPELEIVPWFVKVTNIVVGSWGILGVDLFVIISAWFMVDSKHTVRKVVTVLLQTTAYLLFFIVAFPFYEYSLYHTLKGSVADTIYYTLEKIVDPLWSRQYWFVTAYVLMLLVSPLMNKLLKQTDVIQLKKTLILFFFIPFCAQFSASLVCDVASFCYIYVLVGYIKLYGRVIQYKKFATIYNIALLTSFLIIIKIVDVFTMDSNFLIRICVKILSAYFGIGRHSIPILILSLLIFIRAVTANSFYNKMINWIAMRVFGVYLFHENPSVNVCNLFMTHLIANGILCPNAWFPVVYVGAVLVIFVVGIVFETVLYYVIYGPITRKVMTKYSGLISKADEWIESI